MAPTSVVQEMESLNGTVGVQHYRGLKVVKSCS